MGNGGNQGSEAGDQELQLGREMGAGRKGEERGGGYSNERVEGVPDQVDTGNLIGDKLTREEHGGGCDDPGMLKGFEALWQGDIMKAR
jgi:hypothetical protein